MDENQPRAWKGGRRKKDAKEKMSGLSVWLTPADREKVDALAEKAGVSASAYLRAAGLKQRLRSRFDAEAIMELVKLRGQIEEVVEALGTLAGGESKVAGQGARVVEAVTAAQEILRQIDRQLGLVK